MQRDKKARVLLKERVMKHRISTVLRSFGYLVISLLLFSCGGGGGGGGGDDSAPDSYTGATTQATLVSTNVSRLVENAWEGSRTGPDIGEYFPEIDDSGTIFGTCGGSANVDLSEISGDNTFSGSIVFTDFCIDGATLDGLVSLEGKISQDGMNLIRLIMNFNNLELNEDSESYTLIEGSVKVVIEQDMSGETLTFDLVLRDNTQQPAKTYWLNDYTMRLTYGGLHDTATLSGRFYDYDLGYVDISTLSPLLIDFDGPVGGVLLFSGEDSRARLTFYSDLTTLLELDADNSGNYVPIDPSLAFSLTRQFLQFRTYENPASDRFAALVDYKDNGELLDSGDLLAARIYAPSGVQLSATTQFLSNLYTVATWDSALAQFTGVGTDGDSGFSFNLSGYSDLAAGSYRVEVDAINNQILTSTIDYPGKVELPVVTSSSMQQLWNLDGSLTLSWSEPSGSFHQYRVVFSDQNNLPIFYGRVAPGVSQVTLQAELVQQIKQLSAPTQVGWIMQTRNYVNNDNYARGVSNSVAISWP